MRLTLPFILLFCLKALAAGKIVSTTVGQVGGYVITSREVVIAGVIEKWLLNPIAKNHNNWVIAVNSKEFHQTLTQVMLEKVVVLEAENFSVAQVTPDEIQKSVQKISDDLKDWADWKKLEVSVLELDNQFQRHLRAKAFLKFKTESTGVKVSEEEARQYFEKNHVRFGNMPFAQFKESIREYLTQKQQEDRLRDWFEVLKRKYRVRYLNPPV